MTVRNAEVMQTNWREIPYLDEAWLQQLCGDDNSLGVELCTLFSSQWEEFMQHYEARPSTVEGFQQMRYYVHLLRGSGAALGLRRLVEELTYAESLLDTHIAHTASPPPMQDSLNDILSALPTEGAETLQALHGYLGISEGASMHDK